MSVQICFVMALFWWQLQFIIQFCFFVIFCLKRVKNEPIASRIDDEDEYCPEKEFGPEFDSANYFNDWKKRALHKRKTALVQYGWRGKWLLCYWRCRRIRIRKNICKPSDNRLGRYFSRRSGDSLAEWIRVVIFNLSVKSADNRPK